MAIQTTNPATNKVLRSFEEMSEPAVDKLITQAVIAFASWKTTPFQHRAELLHKVATLMRQKKESLAILITMEMGKLIAQAEGEIDLSADIFEYYATHGEEFLADKLLTPKYGNALIRCCPIGVLLGIEPWNFPFYQVAPIDAQYKLMDDVHFFNDRR